MTTFYEHGDIIEIWRQACTDLNGCDTDDCPLAQYLDIPLEKALEKCEDMERKLREMSEGKG